MNRANAEELYAACERALAELSAAERAVRQIESPDERSALMQALGVAIAEILSSLRAPVVRQFPDLDPPATLGPPDTQLDEQAAAAVARLTTEDIALIDRTLLAECVASWRKVARIVGTAMRELGATFDELPDGYYAQRIAILVQSGHLESQGNLEHMRFSEVRLPRVSQNAV
jgi:Protein of unknown function